MRPKKARGAGFHGPMLAVRLALSSAALFVMGCCLPALGSKEPYSAEALAAHVKSRQATYGDGWTVLATPSFVVIGDGLPNDVRLDAEEVVAVGARKLKAAFFERDPPDIVDVLMLKDDSSYDRAAGTILGPPTTPYGFFSPCQKRIYVNMTNGNGTLVHELVHAFMAANFTSCPVWFNEGLGSLYEQPDLASDPIRGRTNWRLEDLQEAIRDKKTIPIEELLALSDWDFTAKKRVMLTYAMSRYLCYYLQEKGLLQTFYRRFVESHGTDPTGLETLKSVLGIKDMRAFQSEWEAENMKLTFP
ncbi:MAG: hypothetical protein U0441_34540 [Polyangiaceae bacterium]